MRDYEIETTVTLEDMKEYMSDVGGDMVKRTRLMFGNDKAEEVMNLTAYYAAKLLTKIFPDNLPKEDRER